MFGHTITRQASLTEERTTQRGATSLSALQPVPSSAQRPRGHVIGHAIGEPPAVSFAGCPRGHVVGNGGGTAIPLQAIAPLPTAATYREAA